MSIIGLRELPICFFWQTNSLLPILKYFWINNIDGFSLIILKRSSTKWTNLVKELNAVILC